MAGQAALQSSLTPMVLQTVVAVALVAVVAALGFVLVYALVAGSAAGALLLVAGIVRLVWAGVHRVARGVRGHLRRAAPALPLISPETVDLRFRPSG